MKKSLSTIAMIAASIATAQAATGFYAGGTIGKAYDNSATLSKSSDTDYSLLAGYQINQYFSVEGNYANYGNQIDAAGLTNKNTSWGIYAVGFLPLPTISDAVSLYGKLGMARVHTAVDAGSSVNRSNLAYGAGVQYAINSRFDLRAGVDRVSIGNNVNVAQTNINSYSVGAIYHF